MANHELNLCCLYCGEKTPVALYQLVDVCMRCPACGAQLWVSSCLQAMEALAIA